jgi:hypothetical protein
MIIITMSNQFGTYFPFPFFRVCVWRAQQKLDVIAAICHFIVQVGPHGTYVLKSGTDFRDITARASRGTMRSVLLHFLAKLLPREKQRRAVSAVLHRLSLTQALQIEFLAAPAGGKCFKARTSEEM